MAKNTCILCKKDISFLQGKKIQAGMICSTCFEKVPSVAKKNVNGLSKGAIIRMMEWVNEYHNENVKRFERTASYGSLHIDEMHGLFAICDAKQLKGDKLPSNCYDIFHCLNISDFGISTDNASAMNETVSVDIILQCELDIPKIQFKTKIKTNVKCVTKRTDSETLTFSEPRELTMFRTQFQQMYRTHVEKYNYMMQNSFIDKHAVDILLAKNLFMVYGCYSLEEIKSQKKRLLKIFRAEKIEKSDDAMEVEILDEYIRRIKDAYRLLADELMS